MHISLEELLELRDGAADESTRRHLSSCSECSAELARLKQLREEMRALPANIPPASAWDGIAGEMDRRRTRTAVRWLGGFSLAASVVVGVALWFNMGRGGDREVPVPVMAGLEDPAPAGAVPAPELLAVNEQVEPQRVRFGDLPLRARSRLLEERLRAMRPESRVLSGRDAMTAAELEDLIALVDYQLARTRSLDDVRAEKLWQQRVDLMGGLVQVHSQGTRSGLQNANYQQ